MGLVTLPEKKIIDPGSLIKTPASKTLIQTKLVGDVYVPDEILDLDIFLGFDYSQAEVRMLAELSGDPLLIQQFNLGFDIHSLVGSTLTGWPPERIKAEENVRKLVKNMVFGIIYGLQENNLYDYVVGKIRAIDGEKADLTGITKERLSTLYRAFFKKYRGVALFIDKMREIADKTGYVPTLFGFNREIRKEDASRQTFWGNQAINSPVQGSAHQLMLITMAMLHLKPYTYKLLQRPMMEVHDALYFFTKVREMAQAYEQGLELLQKGVIQFATKLFKKQIHVPFKAEAKIGFCMGSMVDYAGGPIAEALQKWREKHKAIEEKSWKKLLTTSDY